MTKHRIEKAEKTRIVSEMATYMIENEGCTKDDLLGQFPKHEVEACHDDAREEAHRLSKRAA